MHINDTHTHTHTQKPKATTSELLIERTNIKQLHFKTHTLIHIDFQFKSK